MFAKAWKTSPRRYEIVHERNVAIPVRAGHAIDCDILRPDSRERFPAILGFFPFSKERMLEPMLPVAVNPELVPFESGDYNFYVRRGYAHVFASCAGTGRSGGLFNHMSDELIEDMYDVIEWLAAQPWCDGQVATFGTSYFAMTAKRVAELRPPSLKTIFAPWGVTDQYRQAIYQGGIFSYVFHQFWLQKLDNLRIGAPHRDRIGKAAFDEQVALALQDPEIAIHPDLVHCLEHPDEGGNMVIAEYVLNYLDTEHYRSKSPRYDVDVEIPGYFGGCWAMHSLHLPGDFESYERWRGPKKLTIGPPYYLDRPVYQYAHESLRWLDHWLKGIDTGIMDEPPIQLFVQNTGEWKAAEEWPLPETRWTEFYLHEHGLLSEHELWPHETASTFRDSPEERGSLTFLAPPLVEATEVCGPLVLNLYASTTDTEALWFVSFLEVDETGREKVLTRGWLRGSQRHVDPERSRPWQPYHTHDRREPLTPGQVYELQIGIVPTGVLLRPGSRFGIRIKCADVGERPADFLDGHALGHLYRTSEAEIAIHHSNRYPSHLLVPITKGNRVGTFMSGGVLGAPGQHA